MGSTCEHRVGRRGERISLQFRSEITKLNLHISSTAFRLKVEM